MRTTVASVCAGISSIESSRGTSVPVEPRTWRIMRAALYRVGPDSGAVHRRRRRFEPGDSENCTEENHHRNASPHEHLALLLLLNIRPGDIHHLMRRALAVPKRPVSQMVQIKRLQPALRRKDKTAGDRLQRASVRL